MVRNDDFLARLSHANTLFSIPMDPHMSLSHAKNKIAEITCLRTLQNVYAPDFTFQLIGDYDINNEFWVHRICITCDDLAVFSHICVVPNDYCYGIVSSFHDNMIHYGLVDIWEPTKVILPMMDCSDHVCPIR